MIFQNILPKAALVLALQASTVWAHDYSVGDLRIDHPWSRATATGAQVGGGYLSIKNVGKAPDRLIEVKTPAAKMVEMHNSVTEKGVMRMREVDNIEIKPGQTVTLKPEGLHLMLMMLDKPLLQGTRFPVTLTFEKAGKVEVLMQVEKAGHKEVHKH